MLFQARLKKLRKDHGLTQQELATALNIARSSISSYENGDRYPDNTNMKKLCEFFHVTEDFLSGNTISEKPPSMKEFLQDTKFDLNTLADLTGINYTKLLNIKNGDLDPDPSDNYLFIDDLLYDGILASLANTDQDLIALLITITNSKNKTIIRLLKDFLMLLVDMIDSQKNKIHNMEV